MWDSRIFSAGRRSTPDNRGQRVVKNERELRSAFADISRGRLDGVLIGNTIIITETISLSAISRRIVLEGFGDGKLLPPSDAPPFPLFRVGSDDSLAVGDSLFHIKNLQLGSIKPSKLFWNDIFAAGNGLYLRFSLDRSDLYAAGDVTASGLVIVQSSLVNSKLAAESSSKAIFDGFHTGTVLSGNTMTNTTFIPSGGSDNVIVGNFMSGCNTDTSNATSNVIAANAGVTITATGAGDTTNGDNA